MSFTAQAEKTVQEKDVALKTGSTINVGPGPLTVVVGSRTDGQGQLKVSLKSDVPANWLKEVSFFGPDGQAVQSEWISDQLFGSHYMKDYTLYSPPEKVTMKLKIFEDIKPVTVPVDLTAGVGF